jgi:hypothetical protein
MHNKILNLLVLTGVICVSTANAAPVATFSALNSPVWLQQNGVKIELGPDDILEIGDNIVTGATGRAEIRLGASAILRLYSNSEIAFRTGNETAVTSSDMHPELYVHHGRVCINYAALSSTEEKLKVNLGNAMLAAIHLQGDVCVLRLKDLSAIKLRAGSVELTHSVAPDTIILSETGTEFHIQDNGTYEILFPGGDDLSTLEIEKPFIIEEAIKADVAGDAATIVESPGAVTEESIATEPGTATQATVSPYIYTVYLFSTRSQEAAHQVNQKFHKAGYETQIYENKDDTGSRYRIVVTGFESRQAAQDFSDSVIGHHGVKETWIGRDKPSVGEAMVEESRSGEPLDNVDNNSSAAEISTSTEPEMPAQDTVSAYIYTVYLFSTSDEEAAQQANQKFHKADYETQIYESKGDAGARYRIVVTGFESRQTAQQFSDSVIGKLGVTGTWIGKESR